MRRFKPLIGGLTLLALAAVLLFMPRRGVFGVKYPFVFDNSFSMNFSSVDTKQLAIEIVVVVLVGGGLYWIAGRMP